MKWTNFRVSDNAHYLIERLTNPTAPKREPVASLHKSINCPITEKTASVLSNFSTRVGKPSKNSLAISYSKGDLCAILVTGYTKAWAMKEADKNWQANESQELRKICAEYIGEMRNAIKANVGAFKITKQMMFSAILHRVVSTQDVKEFFNKML